MIAARWADAEVGRPGNTANTQDIEKTTVTAASKTLNVGERGIFHAKTVLEKGPSRSRGGWRPTHHHRWFTRDIGHPKLKEHVIGVIALMKGATSWPDFYRRLQRAFPKKNEDMPLPLSEPTEN